MEISEIKQTADKVDGWLSNREGPLLYTLAKNCRGRGAIVEIGSWKGKSTIWLGNGSKAGNKNMIFAIDPHTGSSEHKELYNNVSTFEEFKKNIENAGVADAITPIVRTSEDAVKEFAAPVELIFIDGAHEYESVKLDFELWFPKVIEGGIMAFHDTVGFEGPQKVVEEYVYKSKNFRIVSFVDSITFAEKVGKNSLTDRLRNRYVLFLKSAYEFAGSLHLPKQINELGKKIAGLLQ